jgi:general stress protein 26
MFCTYNDDEHIETRPMATQEVDEEGNIWFFSAVDSHKNEQIAVNNHIYLHYSNTSKQNYLSIEGRATIVTDRDVIKQKWNPIAKAWFTEGKDDPIASLIKITPEHAYYWDTKHGKMVSFIKVLASMVTGKTMDDSVEGTITV